MTVRHFEDFEPGQRFDAGEREITAEAIKAFAAEWDPQPFHLDEDAAAESHFGGLIASGFHTLLTAFVLTLESRTWRAVSMGSPGIDEIRWLAPVRPGDRLRVTIIVAETYAPRSKPDRGLVTFDHEVATQDGTVVMTYRSKVFLKRRG